MLRIIDNMSDSENLSDDDDSNSDDDVISPTCEHSDVSESDDSDDNQLVQGGSGLGVTCHVSAPHMDTSVSDSDDGVAEMLDRITRSSRSSSGDRARGRRDRWGDRHDNTDQHARSRSPVRPVPGMRGIVAEE